jgi:hypothetical protein
VAIHGAQSAARSPLDQYLQWTIGWVAAATFGKVCVIVKLDCQHAVTGGVRSTIALPRKAQKTQTAVFVALCVFRGNRIV